MHWLRKENYGVPTKVQHDDLFVGSHAGEEVNAISFGMDGTECKKTKLGKKVALDGPVRTSGAL